MRCPRRTVEPDAADAIIPASTSSACCSGAAHNARASPTPSRVSAKPIAVDNLGVGGQHVRIADPRAPGNRRRAALSPIHEYVVGPVAVVQSEAAGERVGREPDRRPARDRRTPRSSSPGANRSGTGADRRAPRRRRARPRTRARSRRPPAHRPGRECWHPAEIRPGNHASANDIAASTQARVAHARRGPVAIASGTTAAARMPHGASPAPARPVWKCSTDANDSDARGCAPSVGGIGADQRERPRREDQRGTDCGDSCAQDHAARVTRAAYERQRDTERERDGRSRAATPRATPTPRSRRATRSCTPRERDGGCDPSRSLDRRAWRARTRRAGTVPARTRQRSELALPDRVARDRVGGVRGGRGDARQR